MTDEIQNRRKTDRRGGGDRRKVPRRLSDVYPPPNSEKWKHIVLNNIQAFADQYMISLSELKELISELADKKDYHD